MRLVALLFFLLSAVEVSAQTATDHYHTAAQQYIGGEMEAAEQAATAGLAIDPDDTKLQALLERIRQQKEQQDQQQSGDDDQGDQNEDSQDQQENRGESDAQDSEQQDSDEGSQNQPQDGSSVESDQHEEQQEPEQRDDDGQQPSKPQPGDDEATPSDAQPGQMSRAEAERILAALRADESALLRSIQRRQANPRRVERDW